MACGLSLDRAAYDRTEKDSRRYYEFHMQDYFKFQVLHYTLQKGLTRHGWEVKQRKAKGPEIGSLLRRTQLRDVFRKPEYKMTRNTTDLKAAYA